MGGTYDKQAGLLACASTRRLPCGDVAGTWGCVSGVAASAYYWVLEDQPICPSFGGWVD
jgi:hypothetical protein